MYSESELLPLSGLQHLAYCERQWALIHLEGIWVENRLTVEGRHLHERADQSKFETRRDVRTVRGLMIHSLRLGLSGRADVVEFHRFAAASQEQGPTAGGNDDTRVVLGLPLPDLPGEWGPFPVEYKRGKAKRGGCDRVQLCAQALCLEEMLGVPIPAGALFYGQTRRRKDVAIDEPLRSETEQLAAQMHELFRKGRTPIVPYDSKRCDQCSLYSRCLPKTTGASLNVESYIAQAMR